MYACLIYGVPEIVGAEDHAVPTTVAEAIDAGSGFSPFADVDAVPTVLARMRPSSVFDVPPMVTPISRILASTVDEVLMSKQAVPALTAEP
jgi:hypothetical protein